MSDHDGVEQVITMAWRAHPDLDGCQDLPWRAPRSAYAGTEQSLNNSLPNTLYQQVFPTENSVGLRRAARDRFKGAPTEQIAILDPTRSGVDGVHARSRGIESEIEAVAVVSREATSTLSLRV